LSVVTYLLHDDVTGWTDYVNKHHMLRWSRQSGRSSDSSDNEEGVSTGRRSFPQPFAVEPTSASVNNHNDADSLGPTMGSRVKLEVADRTSGTYLTANGENLRSHPCKSNLYIMEQRNEHQKHFTTEHRGVTSHCLRNRSNQWRHRAV